MLLTKTHSFDVCNDRGKLLSIAVTWLNQTYLIAQNCEAFRDTKRIAFIKMIALSQQG